MPKITDLPATSAVDDDAEVPISQGGVTVKATVAQMRGATSSGVSSVNGLTGVVNLAAGDVGATPDPDEVSPVSGLLGTETLAVLQGGGMVQATTQQIADLASGGGDTTEHRAMTVGHQPAQSNRYLMRDGTWRDPLVRGSGTLTVGTPATITDDTKYNAWPRICRLQDGRLLLGYTKADTHHQDTTGVGVGKFGEENADGTITWGSEFTIYDDPSKWAGVYGLTQISTGRIFATLWRDGGGGSTNGEAGFVYSDDDGVTWSAWQDLHAASGFTGASYCSGWVVELPNGDLLVPIEGFASGDDYLSTSSKVVRSTDGGATWGDPVIVADFDTDARPYYESGVLLLDDGSLLALHRTSDGPSTHYQNRSTDGGATWDSPVTAFLGYGACNFCQLSSGTIVAITRRYADGAVVAFTSIDRGSSWSAGTEVDATMYEMEYGAPIELLDGRVLVVYGYQPTSSTSNSDIKQAIATEARTSLARRGVKALTDGANIAVDALHHDNFRVTLGGNRTLDNPTNLSDGQVINFRIKQDGTGSRTLAYGSKYKFAGGAPALSTAAGALDFISCQYDAADDTLVCAITKAVS